MNHITILVVDEQEAHCELMRSALVAAGYAVLTAASGDQAMERVRSQYIGLVLTDQQMPGISGLELLRAVQELRPQLPVVMVTAHGTVATAVDAMRAGAVDLSKSRSRPRSCCWWCGA